MAVCFKLQVQTIVSIISCLLFACLLNIELDKHNIFMYYLCVNQNILEFFIINQFFIKGEDVTRNGNMPQTKYRTLVTP